VYVALDEIDPLIQAIDRMCSITKTPGALDQLQVDYKTHSGLYITRMGDATSQNCRIYSIDAALTTNLDGLQLLKSLLLDARAKLQ
jgi:hypothetical protein